jgi:hypothetical protein
MCRGKQDLLALSDDGLDIPKGFFVMFTSQPGFKSYTRKEGSLFVDVFTGLLKKRGTIWPLEKIFTETAKTVCGTVQGNPDECKVKQKPHHYKNGSEEIWLADEGKCSLHLLLYKCP